MNLLRLCAGALLAAVCAFAASGCGESEMPSDAVAMVGDTVITKQQFDHWYASTAKGQVQGQGNLAAPDPPDFTKCVASLKKAQSSDKASTKPSDSDLEKQCKQNYDQLKQQVMQFLLQSAWIQQEAAEQDVEVSGAEVRKLFEEQKKQAFPKQKDYEKFLRTSGSTEQDLLFRIKLDALQKELTAKVQEGVEEVTDEDIAAYYKKHEKRFGQPEKRDLHVVLAKTKAQAEKAKKQLEAGASFKQVANRYSIDQASKAQGGRLPNVVSGQQEKELDDAVFGAEKGEIVGPVENQFGWYVFEVDVIEPSSKQSLDEVRETIRSQLETERGQKATTDFGESFREDFKDKTRCREGFVIADCGNAPDEKTDTSAPQQGVPPTQGAPQQAPPTSTP